MSKGGWIAPAVGAATGLIGMIGQRKREQRQMDNNRTLMDWQKQNQKELNEHGSKLQYEMWKKTNHPAQVAMMEKAGINPALMYGGSGAGGTTGGQSGGSAGGGSAPQQIPMSMDIQNIVSAVKAVAELGKVKAETATEKEKPRLVSNQADGAYYDAANKNYSDKTNPYVQELLKGMEVQNEGKDLDNQEQRIKNEILGATKENEKFRLINEAILSELKLQAEKANIKLTKEQAGKIWHDIRVNWTNAGFNGLGKVVQAALGGKGGKK